MKLCLITILFSHYLPMLNNIKLLDCFKEFGPWYMLFSTRSLIMVWMKVSVSLALNQWIVITLFHETCLAIWSKSHISLTLKFTISILSYIDARQVSIGHYVTRNSMRHLTHHHCVSKNFQCHAKVGLGKVLS